MKRLLSALAVACVAVAVPIQAHHSFNTFYDMSRTVEIQGVVKSFKLVSPHSEMILEVPDASGKPVEWRITARTGAVNAKREGWKTLTIDCGHDVMLDKPAELAAMLRGAARGR